ncbi:hypothetical protein RV11_GL002252 [Enterococcus phoeniculicola]|jgi:AAA+ ATPase superfamily predicted ATPase|uniref:Uncharacterized protein n=1 Tax=Enterococcus phoeniculicola ATCC BAA-412 TaxID=1158610 RepID=R3TQI1_9ENTE|nr:hypothetical protein [Enterococcus phoeniculicola]EOL43799.1 hypothetical protein UC3_01780 [Enterococcus phoeniculicola ATCC BAA-412]EOT76837.1 hypothetical protein I589_01795 [Enterococcus phoeniculicola ATCC BAA-412]OJG69726.1 hypothetical protein RV11_GL002252 [Enterococcus phoeniculicola]
MYLWDLDLEAYFTERMDREIASEREYFLVDKFKKISKKVNQLMAAITPSNCVESLKTIIKEEGKLNLCVFYLTEDEFDSDNDQLNELDQRIEKDYMDYLAFIDSKTQFDCDQYLLLNNIIAEKELEKARMM